MENKPEATEKVVNEIIDLLGGLPKVLKTVLEAGVLADEYPDVILKDVLDFFEKLKTDCSYYSYICLDCGYVTPKATENPVSINEIKKMNKICSICGSKSCSPKQAGGPGVLLDCIKTNKKMTKKKNGNTEKDNTDTDKN